MALKKTKYKVTSTKRDVAIQKQLAGFGGLAVAAGLPADKIHNQANIPLSELGAIHEFGLPERGIPERSFLRATLVARGGEAQKLLIQAAQNVAIKGTRPEDELEKIALWLQGAIQEYIVELKTPPKSEASIRRNPDKTNPLILTGEMRQGVLGVVTRD